MVESVYPPGFARRAVQLMVLMMQADGEVTEDELEEIRSTLSAIVGSEVSEELVRLEAQSAKDYELTVEKVAALAKDELDADALELLLQPVAMVAAADGEFADAERDMLIELAGAVGASDEALQGALESLSAD